MLQAVKFDKFSRALMTPLGMGPRRSSVDIRDDGTVHVRMGWGFRTTFPRSAVVAATPARPARITRGVHGWRGTWLVNGASDGLVELSLQPVQKARVLGFPVRLRALIVGVEDPDGLIEACAVQ